jgi:hypothetical protein
VKPRSGATAKKKKKKKETAPQKRAAEVEFE